MDPFATDTLDLHSSAEIIRVRTIVPSDCAGHDGPRLTFDSSQMVADMSHAFPASSRGDCGRMRAKAVRCGEDHVPAGAILSH
jgi:hypothetical protein